MNSTRNPSRDRSSTMDHSPTSKTRRSRLSSCTSTPLRHNNTSRHRLIPPMYRECSDTRRSPYREANKSRRQRMNCGTCLCGRRIHNRSRSNSCSRRSAGCRNRYPFHRESSPGPEASAVYASAIVTIAVSKIFVFIVCLPVWFASFAYFYAILFLLINIIQILYQTNGQVSY